MSENEGDTANIVVDASISKIDDTFFRSLVANTSEGLLTIDAESTIIFANRAIEDILGYSPDELVGSSKLAIIPERLRPVHERQLRNYIETGEKNIDWDGVRLPALHKDGHEVPVTISLREHEFDGMRLFTGIVRDVSELKAKRELLEAQNERLQMFANVLSHDVRNPLNVAQSYTELLSEDVDRQELTEVRYALDRIEQLVDDMTSLVRRDDDLDVVAPLDVETLATEAWRWIETDDAELVVADVEPIRADRTHFKSLLENVFSNAVTHGGSDVTVRLGSLEDGNGFYVADDGRGIEPDHRERVFEHGFTTSSDGTGLGLSIVDQIATAHGWTVELADSTTGGTRYEFRL
ncbi:PAS domain S-box protein [Natrarchaeobius oligotrophus]|uniref:histidine kinase n=1 Tax=Natrarchaeobius chitinivorans TaxID=1679083 RepID=A0A3N6LZ76_NATCH|nr:PAS domain-containing sensor histidine kinase [Natrarchaeobius chitinivorans]RQG96168.1 PAS domain S-box protein [Natrarchaeobius chitinivorans]